MRYQVPHQVYVSEVGKMKPLFYKYKGHLKASTQVAEFYSFQVHVSLENIIIGDIANNAVYRFITTQPIIFIVHQPYDQKDQEEHNTGKIFLNKRHSKRVLLKGQWHLKCSNGSLQSRHL
ncbi:hypothetical protein [Flavipsychrobacter stenotrophus]|uniref:hypothetical protein n=1 Tax=Flavipsychrobacter stenotrophus TaxID=2077091 RepID=UPI003743D25D